MKNLNMEYSDFTERVYWYTNKENKIDVTKQLEHIFRTVMKHHYGELKIGSLTFIEKEDDK